MEAAELRTRGAYTTRQACREWERGAGQEQRQEREREMGLGAGGKGVGVKEKGGSGGQGETGSREGKERRGEKGGRWG